MCEHGIQMVNNKIQVPWYVQMVKDKMQAPWYV